MEKEKLIAELRYKAVRSSGAGGQNVNKVSSKIQLTFDVSNSTALTDEELKLPGVLVIFSPLRIRQQQQLQQQVFRFMPGKD